ncbi:MAG: NosD domain-containing protein [Thermoleophilia bacterium]
MQASGIKTVSLDRAASGSYLMYMAALGFSVALLLFLLFIPAAQAASMYVLQDNATGGDCTTIGAWNDLTTTCTLNTDIAVAVAGDTGIEIVSDGLTLDGDGHQITGLGATFPPPDPFVWVPEYAVVLNDVTNTQVRNLKITDIDAGVQVSDGSDNLVITNEIRDCTHGVWLVLSTGNKVTQNLMGNNMWASVDLAASDFNEVQGNIIESSPLWGIRLFEGDDNLISGNTISNSGTPAAGMGTGVYIFYSNGNDINTNLLAGAMYGVNTDVGADNLITSNHFRGNTIQADDEGDNIFDAPSGGNLWDDFDEPGEGCLDADVNGFCDAPYLFTGNQDNLPRVGRPDLRLHMISVYWSSYLAYTEGILSIDYEVMDMGAAAAEDTRVLGTVDSAGVTNAGALPLMLGDIAAGAITPFTLLYSIPPGTVSFHSTVFVTAKNHAGTLYEYPGPFS